MSTRVLREHASTLRRFAAETGDQARANPSDFLLQLAAKSQRDAAQEAEKDLLLAESEEMGELMDLRLIAAHAMGSVSLDWFLQAMDPLNQALKLAAHRLKHGQEAIRIGREIAPDLNLKLAGIAAGSTRILLTGNGMPDAAGDNLLRSTLTQAFRLLNGDEEKFFDAVDAIGAKSAKQMGDFVRALESGGYIVDFTWRTFDGQQRWDGQRSDIARIRSLLDTVREPDESTVMIEGAVAAIRDTGLIEIRTADLGKVSIRFPLVLTEQVRTMTITSHVRVKVRRFKYWDGARRRDFYKHLLLSVE